jgi:hypothetical protein
MKGITMAKSMGKKGTICGPNSRHPGYHKTVVVVKKQYYWLGMKNEVVDFIARCLECQKVKDEHIHPVGSGCM